MMKLCVFSLQRVNKFHAKGYFHLLRKAEYALFVLRSCHWCQDCNDCVAAHACLVPASKLRNVRSLALNATLEVVFVPAQLFLLRLPYLPSFLTFPYTSNSLALYEACSHNTDTKDHPTWWISRRFGISFVQKHTFQFLLVFELYV